MCMVQNWFCIYCSLEINMRLWYERKCSRLCRDNSILLVCILPSQIIDPLVFCELLIWLTHSLLNNSLTLEWEIGGRLPVSAYTEIIIARCTETTWSKQIAFLSFKPNVAVALQSSAVVMICCLSVLCLGHECIVAKRLKLGSRGFTKKTTKCLIF